MGIEKLSADANYLNMGQDFLDWHWWNCVKLQWKKPDQIIGVLLGLDQICYTQFFICRKKTHFGKSRVLGYLPRKSGLEF